MLCTRFIDEEHHPLLLPSPLLFEIICSISLIESLSYHGYYIKPKECIAVKLNSHTYIYELYTYVDTLVYYKNQTNIFLDVLCLNVSNPPSKIIKKKLFMEQSHS
jgi:hypothetical protein